MLVGEIGIPRLEYLYQLQYWEIILICRGYYRRNRDLWSATRWSTFYIMSSQADLSKSGISRPSDLMKFPWEKEAIYVPPDDVVEDLQSLMASENERIEQLKNQEQ